MENILRKQLQLLDRNKKSTFFTAMKKGAFSMIFAMCETCPTDFADFRPR